MCASVMPGISVAPAPSITVMPAVAMVRTPLATRADAVALDQHLAGIGRRAAAVDDADVGEQHVRHVTVLPFGRASRFLKAAGVHPRPAPLGGALHFIRVLEDRCLEMRRQSHGDAKPRVILSCAVCTGSSSRVWTASALDALSPAMTD